MIIYPPLKIKLVLSNKSFYCRSVSNPVPRSRHGGPRSPPLKGAGHVRPSHSSVAGGSSSSMHTKRAPIPTHHSSAGGRGIPTSPPHMRGGPIVDDKQTKLPPIKHRIEEKVRVRVSNSEQPSKQPGVV